MTSKLFSLETGSNRFTLIIKNDYKSVYITSYLPYFQKVPSNDNRKKYFMIKLFGPLNFCI